MMSIRRAGKHDEVERWHTFWRPEWKERQNAIAGN